MKSFDDAWKENRHVWESTKNLAKAMYLAGAQSRQAEIDELKTMIERMIDNTIIAIDDDLENQARDLLKGDQS